ncbi:UDP-2,3-diacylglucosamine diphosphatase [Ferrimonas senticii]|uniref:UDP-2,3-diacylglucosamine diphosphatase n=1 Tax=Ferrimonas senticii TaxID=394566 RepID=UPI00041CABCA|nr:UDP-2,3-diacylglucosamine diphosphatase [Ferrimonas senticii]
MKVNASEGAQSGSLSASPRTLFIGDLHLSEQRPDIFQAFQRFIGSQLNGADALYIIGDLFEAWIGDDDRSDFNEQVAALLKQASQQLPIYFCNGNRDFLISKKFCQRAGLTLLPEIAVIDLYGTKACVLHGDLLCTDDLAYQKFRRRWPFYRVLQKFLPLSKRRQMAIDARAKSQARNSQLDQAIMDVTPQAVTALLQKTGSDWLIHGHTHRPALHQLEHGQQRLVVGDWYSQDSVLIVTPSGVSLQSQPLP